ncbi:hypothetical protein B0J14DRAFT_669970 [Halenospora varia]|nr:hypothetical protein B0J14DRAFT_669970 [Halenospora varia]
MTVVSYHSTIIREVASEEAADTTSSQIFLSRGVAGSTQTATSLDLPTLVTTISETTSRHIMTLGDAASATKSSKVGAEMGTDIRQGDSIKGMLYELFCCIGTDYSAQVLHKLPPRMNQLKTINLGSFPLLTNSTSEPHLQQGLQPSRPHEEGSTAQLHQGRTLERQSRLPNPLERAESRKRKGDVAIEIDARSLARFKRSRSSTLHDNPSDLCAILDDNLLEPCPHDPVCTSVSEVLNSPGSLFSRANSDSLEPTTPGNPSQPEQDVPALRTVFSHCRPLHPAPLPSSTATNILSEIHRLEYLAINSSSRIWLGSQNSPPHAQKAHPSSANRLPTEILQQIYLNLRPTDFNSARHTCRSWFIGSLERVSLETMLKRGGFSGVLHDMTGNHVLDAEVKVSDEWLMSKRLSRECALGPDWTGNGLTKLERQPEDQRPSAMTQISSVDFTEVAVHYAGLGSAGTIFTASTCQRFLMAANGSLVYIYELNINPVVVEQRRQTLLGGLRPVTSIVCPRRVLACSMDTSSGRYAIAILIDGRMGLVCDLAAMNQSHLTPQHGRNSRKGSKGSVPTHSSVEDFDNQTHQVMSFLDRVHLNSSSSNLVSSGAPPNEPPFVFPGIATARSSFAPLENDLSEWEDAFTEAVPQTSRDARQSAQSSSLPRATSMRPESRMHSILPPISDGGLESFIMPIETGPRSLYRNLCSEDDPPRSVAICPQRKCVAFGCSSGIELHWVDALTGQDLNRWFPLTAPSDYLFFLPPRRSVDSAKKLRLISSAARPSERAAIGDTAFGGRTRNSPFWERFAWWLLHGQGILAGTRIAEPPSRTLNGRIEYSDHYRAVPLSDGYHILFTDPVTGLLCLGSDAPVGGPTKLLRKIWFQGPTGQGSPIAYAGGSSLRWGVRVAAAFGTGDEQSIWLFSVPGDIFAADQKLNNLSGGPAWSSTSAGSDHHNSEWLDWWPDDGLKEWLKQHKPEDPISGIHPRNFWPVKIRGQEIGKCAGVVDLAVDSGPNMIVWAFSRAGVAKSWRIDNGGFESMKTWRVIRDGTIRNTGEEDEKGAESGVLSDVASTSEPEILEPPFPLHQETFDGPSSPALLPLPSSTASQAEFVFTTRSARRHHIEWNEESARDDFDASIDIDADGDVRMGGMGVMDALFNSELTDIVMTDSDNDEMRTSQDNFEHVAFASARGEIWYESSRWRNSGGMVFSGGPGENGDDVVPEGGRITGDTSAYLRESVGGIVRIDVEIR